MNSKNQNSKLKTQNNFKGSNAIKSKQKNKQSITYGVITKKKSALYVENFEVLIFTI